MRWMKKIASLDAFYRRGFDCGVFLAGVKTSGSYAKKVRDLARLGKRTSYEVELVCRQVEHMRCAFKIMDDLIDEDTVRDDEPAFWSIHGTEATIEQAGWEVKQAREISQKLGVSIIFKKRLQEVISGAQIEVEMENPEFVVDVPLPELWQRIVLKEAAFRKYIAEALKCSAEVCNAMFQDGIAAQILDDGLSALYGKDGRVENSDEKLSRLTYMRAFGVPAGEAVKRGKEMKTRIKTILEEGNEKN